MTETRREKAERYVRASKVQIVEAETTDGGTHVEAEVDADTGIWHVETYGTVEECSCPANELGHLSCSHIEAVWLELRYGALWRATARGLARSRVSDENHKETP